MTNRIDDALINTSLKGCIAMCISELQSLTSIGVVVARMQGLEYARQKNNYITGFGGRRVLPQRGVNVSSIHYMSSYKCRLLYALPMKPNCTLVDVVVVAMQGLKYWRQKADICTTSEGRRVPYYQRRH